MKKIKDKKALIYCRVSSERQKNEGNGLDSQEKRCRDFAVQKEFTVREVFKDSFSGGGDFMKRPAMKELLEYVDSKPHEEFVVIFDDLKRFARDTVFHIKLKQAFHSRGIIPLCLNFNFEDTPEGEFIETILAAQGQLERQQNKRQVIQKQKARLDNGYWAFGSIMGYKQLKTPEHGMLLTPIESEAPMIKEALEGFAHGRFKDKKDVADFLVSMNFRGRKSIHYSTVDRLFSVLYAGYIEYPKWEVERRKGFHEPLISLDVWEINQAKLHGRKKVMTRRDTNPDFPLRGFINCHCCSKPLTASWTKGRSARYPFYRCNQKSCDYGNKSINRDKLHPKFEEQLSNLEPSKEILELVREITKDVWESKQKDLCVIIGHLEEEKKETQDQIDTFMDRISSTDNISMIDVYEDKIEKLSNEKTQITSQILQKETTDYDFGTALDSILEKVKSPKEYWSNGDLEDKKNLCNLVYSGPIVYDWENGFGTAEISPIFNVFEEFAEQNLEYVEKRGIEPRSITNKITHLRELDLFYPLSRADVEDFKEK